MTPKMREARNLYLLDGSTGLVGVTLDKWAHRLERLYATPEIIIGTPGFFFDFGI